MLLSSSRNISGPRQHPLRFSGPSASDQSASFTICTNYIHGLPTAHKHAVKLLVRSRNPISSSVIPIYLRRGHLHMYTAPTLLPEAALLPEATPAPGTCPVLSATEARLVNTLISTSLASRSRVISALRRYCSSRCRSDSTSHGSSDCPKKEVSCKGRAW